MEPVAGLHKSSWTARSEVNLPSGVHGCCQRDGKIPLFQARANNKHHWKDHCNQGKKTLPGFQLEHFSLSLIFPCGSYIARPLPWPFSSLFPSFLHREEPHFGGGYGRQSACLRECVPCLLSAMPMQPVLLKASSFQHPLCHVGEFHFRPKCHWLAFLIISQAISSNLAFINISAWLPSLS